jgi:hypothetical protein
MASSRGMSRERAREGVVRLFFFFSAAPSSASVLLYTIYQYTILVYCMLVMRRELLTLPIAYLFSIILFIWYLVYQYIAY